MSLINQVLKDLDRQRGPAAGNHIAALQGIGLVQGASLWPRIALVFGMLLALSLAGVAAFQWLQADTPEPVQPVAADAVAGPPEPAAITDEPEPAVDKAAADAVAEPIRQTPPVAAAASAPEVAPATTGTQRVAEPEPAPVALQAPPARASEPVAIKRMSPRQTAEKYFVAAQQAIDRGDMAGAEAGLKQALAEYPAHGDARLELAGLYIAGQRPGLAEDLLIAGLALNPRQAALRRLYAQLLADRQAYASALEILQQADTDDRDGAETLGLRAAIHARLQQYDASANDYRRALKSDPKRAEWWAGFGIALEHLGRREAAAQAYRRALQLPLAENLQAFVAQRQQLLQTPIIVKDE